MYAVYGGVVGVLVALGLLQAKVLHPTSEIRPSAKSRQDVLHFNVQYILSM